MDQDEATLESGGVNQTAENAVAQDRSHPSLSDRRPSQRPSLRVRPSQLLREQDAAPLSPLKSTGGAPPLVHRSSSKMSLFNLFSKPKVEKARGHTEQGLTFESNEPTPPPLNKRHTTVLKKGSAPALRKPSVAAPSNREQSQWQPPPLFQAYPQAIKHGLLEVSPLTAELVLHLHKQRKVLAAKPGLRDDAPRDAPGGRLANSSTGKTVTAVELPRKILILTTSGHLLLYSATGSSERLPERALPLHADSAVFASDMIPGRHHVLQVSHSADKRSVTTNGSGSIFSKFSLRSAASRREMQNCLLVLASPEDMDSWLSTIRKEIRLMNGNQPRPETAIKQQTISKQPSFNELKRTPSQSHRYRVKRDPSKIDLCSPTASEFSDTTRLAVPTSGRDNSKCDDISETATLDGIEQEAACLEQSPPPLPISDTPNPPTAGDATVAVASSESQNSDNVEPDLPHPKPVDEDSAEEEESTLDTRSPSNSHATSTIDGNQSDVPDMRSSSSSDPAMVPSEKLDQRIPGQQQRLSKDIGSHVARSDQVIPPPLISPRTSSIPARVPSLPHGADATRIKGKRDSKFSSPSVDMTADQNVELNRPVSLKPAESLIVDQRYQQRKSVILEKPPKNRESMRSFRQSMYGFSIPLKVNPSHPPTAITSSREPRKRASQNLENIPPPPPIVHTLTAKVDASHRRLSLQTSATAYSTYDTSQPRVPRANSVRRLPSLPSTAELQTASTVDTHNLHTYQARGSSPSTSPQNAAPALRRPNSIQIRSSHAPFLENMRAPVNRSDPSMGTATAVPFHRPVPIRALRPSRSTPLQPTTSMAATSSRLSMGGAPRALPLTESIATTSRFIESDEEDEAFDLPSPLPQEEALLSMASRTSSRTSSRISIQRRSQLVSSLPNVAISIHSLGPPAPPPQAPLPPTPKIGSACTSPRLPVSSSPTLAMFPSPVQTLPPRPLHETPLSPLRMHPPANGLGITI